MDRASTIWLFDSGSSTWVQARSESSTNPNLRVTLYDGATKSVVGAGGLAVDTELSTAEALSGTIPRTRSTAVVGAALLADDSTNLAQVRAQSGSTPLAFNVQHLAVAPKIAYTETPLASAVRSAATNSSDFTTPQARGLVIFANITVVPGVDTITFILQQKDPETGNYVDVLTGAARSATGMVRMVCYPGITTSANVAVSDIISYTWRIRVTHSAATNFTYSASAVEVG